LIDPGEMGDRLPQGFKHIKATAVEGVDVLLNEINDLCNT